MNLMKTLIATATVAASLSATAAQFDKIEPSAELAQKVQQVLGNNAQSVTYFDTGFNNLTAVTIVSKQMKKHTFFTNDEGSYFLAGNLIDGANQRNLTANFEARVNIEFPEDLKQRIASLPAVVQGEGGTNVVYAVIDHNCGFCHRKYQNVQQYYAEGAFDNVEVRWIPVGFLGQDSQTKAFAMSTLIDSDHAQASQFLASTMRKQSPAIPQDLLIQRDGVMAAEKMMRDYGFGGVPFVLMKDANDNWTMSSGLPQRAFFASVMNQSPPESSVGSE